MSFVSDQGLSFHPLLKKCYRIVAIQFVPCEQAPGWVKPSASREQSGDERVCEASLALPLPTRFVCGIYFALNGSPSLGDLAFRVILDGKDRITMAIMALRN